MPLCLGASAQGGLHVSLFPQRSFEGRLALEVVDLGQGKGELMVAASANVT